MRKLIILIAVFLCSIPALSWGEDFFQKQLNSGIRNSDVYSYLLIQQAHQNNSESVKSLEQALVHSPDLPAVYFELARAKLSFSVIGILDSIDFIIQGIDAYLRNFWWSFTMAGALFFSLVISFSLAILIIIMIRLFSDIPLISHDINENRLKAFILLALIPLALASPYLLLAGILVLLGIYMTRSDKSVVYLFLALLLLFPFILKTASLFIHIPASGAVRAIVEVNESKGNNYAITALTAENDYVALFSRALALKRTGRYEDAISLYSRLADHRQDPKVFINLGNCYVGLNDYEKAVSYYFKAIEIKSLASAYYNLSQISRETFDFQKGDEHFKSSLALDRFAVSRYRAIYGRSPNRLVVDETLSFAELWDYVADKPRKASSLSIAVIAPVFMPLFSIALASGFFLVSKRFRFRAYRCRRCDTILCTKCEKRLIWGQMCPQCYRSLVKLDELDVKERVARLLSIYAHQKKRRDIMTILSFILPGSPLIFSGRILKGLLFLWPFLFFVLVPVMTTFFGAGSPIMSHSFVNWTALLIAAMIYGVTNIVTRQRIAKGWL